MHRFTILFLTLFIATSIRAQIMPKLDIPPDNTPAKQTPKPTPKPVVPSGTPIEVTWQGDEVVKIFFDNMQKVFRPGQAQTLYLKAGDAIKVQVVSAEATYIAKEFLMVENSQSYLTIFLSGNDAKFTYKTKEQAIAGKAAGEKAEEEKKMETEREEVQRKSAENAIFSFYDDFSDNSKNWSVGNYSDRETNISNGKYNFKVLTDRSFYIYKILDINANKPFSCNVTVKWMEGITNNGFGLDFCSNGSTNSFYTFLVSANGYYVIQFIENNSAWKNLKPWTKSDIVNQNNAPNILSIKEENDFIHFFINNTEVAAFPFDGGYGNGFGFRVSGMQTVEFDNFKFDGTRK